MLKKADVSRLNVQSTPRDLRKDLVLFMDYVENNEIKRAHRTNNLPRAVYTRLGKLMKLEGVKEELQDHGYCEWIDFVDSVALKLGFVKYDTEGEYVGYTSSSPSFPNNYIEIDKTAWAGFLSLPALRQELSLLNYFKDAYHYDNNELIRKSIHSWLDVFDGRGIATGPLPTLNFQKSRETLLSVLQKCELGVWYTVDSLTALMKQEHPWFLIPEKVVIETKLWNRQVRRDEYARYYNFCESKERWGYSHRDKHIADTDPQGFKKVEGRFIERFLAGFIHTLGYVDVAYDQDMSQEIYPSIGKLQAFRLHPVFFQIMNRQALKAKVSVQPNFEIYIDAPVYPLRLMQLLFPLTDLVKDDRQIILKLNKKYVLQALVENPDLDLLQLLKNLSHTPIPQNIEIELKEWTGRTNAFVLYEGFGVYEGLKINKLVNSYIVEQITPNIRLVRNAEQLLLDLERAEQIPLGISHGEKQLKKLPKAAKTVFSKRYPKPPKPQKIKATVLRQEFVLYFIRQKDLYDELLTALLKAKCLLEIDADKQSIRFSKQEEKKVKEILAELKERFDITLKKKT